MSKRDEFVEKMKRQLDDWNAEIDNMDEKIAKVKTDLKAKYEKQVEEIRKKRAEGAKKLEELQSAGEEAWERVKDETEHSWAALKDAVNTFKSHYKKDTEKD
jgi:hypothetical protein